MTTTPPPDEPLPPHGWFTVPCMRLAKNVHGWVRFAAIVTGISGVMMLVVTLFAVFSGTVAVPQIRGLIAAVGSIYVAVSLAILCMALMLFRYAEKLLAAGEQRRTLPLLEAAPYETAYWTTAAALAGAWLLAMALSVGARNTTELKTPERVANPVEAETPLPLNAVAMLLVASGIAMLATAARPPRLGSGD